MQCGSRYVEQRAPATTLVPQRQGGGGRLQGRWHRQGWSPTPLSYRSMKVAMLSRKLQHQYQLPSSKEEEDGCQGQRH